MIVDLVGVYFDSSSGQENSSRPIALVSSFVMQDKW